ncbi:hypothetical protein [Actinomadura madurae]|uniref:hypothetical protein n=1 Tax=Actinomadura madurae TaxID=1993 RepID=UPI0027E32F70|nr:hypothetical protein [Actinomadura madurae]
MYGSRRCCAPWREPVLARWVELVTPGIRGRLTEHEVQAELGELYGLVERSWTATRRPRASCGRRWRRSRAAGPGRGSARARPRSACSR